MTVKKISANGAEKQKKKKLSPSEGQSSARTKDKLPAAGKNPPEITRAVKKNQKKDIIPAETEEPGEIEAITRGDNPMTVVEHLEEFRYRLLVCLGALIVIAIVSFNFSDFILEFIARPFAKSGNRLNIFTLTEGFIIRLKTSALSALLISLPLIIFHLWRYVAPAISVQEKKGTRWVVFFSLIMFYAGVTFVFFIVIPYSITVLLGFVDKNMSAVIGANDYLGFIFIFCAGMGVLFQLPVVVMLLTKADMLSPQYLIAKRRYAIVIIWIMAAVVTPPEVLSQALVAIPVMGLYELSIIISKFVTIRKKRRELKYLTRV